MYPYLDSSPKVVTKKARIYLVSSGMVKERHVSSKMFKTLRRC